MFNIFTDLLIPFCEAREYEYREYSGRNFAKDCFAFVIPNGNRELISFVFELATECMEIDSEDDRELVLEEIEDFFRTIETDSMGRDSQVIYSRNLKWSEYEQSLEELPAKEES
jgi:hypothetical protein